MPFHTAGTRVQALRMLNHRGRTKLVSLRSRLAIRRRVIRAAHNVINWAFADELTRLANGSESPQQETFLEATNQSSYQNIRAILVNRQTLKNRNEQTQEVGARCRA